MEKEKKQQKFGKKIGWAILTYVVISFLVGISREMRIALQEGKAANGSGVLILEFVLVPVLFLLAGYLCSAGFGLGKFKTYRVLLLSAGFSGLLLLLWYIFLELYVVLNLPVAEGGYALDLFLRKIIMVQGYRTDTYRDVILPLLHFILRIVYWLFYLWGNRVYVSKQKK